ncbi:MAG: hypothetical protein Q7R62_00705 [bacterium]|nr:hypothetical protein [bacterium]
MIFTVSVKSHNLISFMRLIGYKPVASTMRGEINCMRSLGGDYPRFHAYVKEGENGFTFNLHLDQKKPSYEGNHAHSGEYEGENVNAERARIESKARAAGDEEEEEEKSSR